jgi:membrane protease YdiL (CAAX protease family)
MNFKSFLKSNSLWIYFILAYMIAWGGILLIAASKGFNPRAIQLPEGGLMFLCMILGPSLGSIALTALMEGKDGIKNLFARMKDWRVGLGNYLPILTVPVLSTSVLLVLCASVSAIYRPSVNIGFGVAIGMLAGFFEETGWTGFALPRLQSKFNPTVSGVILGLLWSFWHIMADYWGNIANFGAYWFPHFILYWIIPLTAYRILMSWVYKKTGSLLLGQIMHMFYTGTLVAVSPILSVSEGFLWEAPFVVGLVVSVMFWIQWFTVKDMECILNQTCKRIVSENKGNI